MPNMALSMSLAKLTLHGSVIFALASSVTAGFVSTSQTNVAVYWGQNSYGQATSQQRLSTYCSNTKLNIIPIAFMNGIKTAVTNFANAGDNCTLYTGTQLLSCPQMEEDVKLCQTKYSKTIILSLGGATYSEGGFASSAEAQGNAAKVWSLFGSNITAANRPFLTAVVDGFDFDFETTTKNSVPFAATLRSLMDADTAKTGRKYYLAAAPQCPYRDLALGDILDNVAMDFVMVQFYNNYCGLQSFNPSAPQQNNFNFAIWDQWARETSINKKVKVFLGVPANTGAAGSGYLPANKLAPIVAYCKTFASFGGVMMWDMSQMAANAGFLDGVYAALTQGGGTGTSTIATATSTRSVSSSSTSTRVTSSSFITSSRTSSTSSSSRGTATATGCVQVSTITVTATVTVRSGGGEETEEPDPDTGAQGVPQWGQCGGQGYTGPTTCQPPYKCVNGGQWWSDCR